MKKRLKKKLRKKLCSNNNKKCKICKFDTCKEVINMLEIQERNIRKEKIRKMKQEVPEQCRNCSFLEFKENTVYCFYKKKDGCMLK